MKGKDAMQLGLTIPLQRRLKIPSLPPGGGEALYCWDAHAITLHGRPCLLGVHCLSRCVFILLDPPAHDWADIGKTAQSAVFRLLREQNLPCRAVQRYLVRCGSVQCTKTHGRREVAFLNRAWDDVLASSQAADPFAVEQPLLENIVNSIPCRCAGEEGLYPASEHLRRLLAEDG